MSVTPTTAELIAAICFASFTFNRRVDNLTLFNKIKSDHPNWDIDLAVLQRQLVQLGETNNNFGSSTRGEDGRKDRPLKEALRRQLDYQEKSKRSYRMLGAEYDYGVSFNPDVGVFFSTMQTRAIDEPPQRPLSLYNMYDHLQYAAVKAGVPKENLRRQLWDEFDCDPLVAAPPTPRTAAERAHVARREEMSREQYKTTSLEKMRAMLQHAESRKDIPVDRHGEPIWDELINGRYVVMITKLKKGSGLEELETW